jgi:hypothetical protein
MKLRYVFVAIFMFVFWVIVTPFVFSDPTQQVKRGYDNARIACAQGKAINEQQRKLCRMLQ